MCGRAGRKGKDEIGETYLCCKPNDIESVVDLMQAELPEVSSGLTVEARRLHRGILEIITIGLARSLDMIEQFVSKTLLYKVNGQRGLSEEIKLVVDELVMLGYIKCQNSDAYVATKLGSAIVASGLDPQDGAFVYHEMRRALQALAMDGEMHIMYVFTPVTLDSSATINWRVYREEMESMDEGGFRVLRLLDIKPSVIHRLAQGGVLKEVSDSDKQQARVYRRFYFALQLRDLCNEMPIHAVARKYDISRGLVQTLAQTCQGFAAGMIKFCDIMGWGPNMSKSLRAMSATLNHVSDRLHAGARSDLLDLAKITFIKSRTARVFWENGFKTIESIANSEPSELVPILMQAQPTKLKNKDIESDMYAEKLLIKAKAITASANRLWLIQLQEERESYEEE